MGKMFMELMVLVGVIGTASGISSFNDDPDPDGFNPSWMEYIDDDSKLLSQITIPGTHNAMSRYYGERSCQSWNLANQLRAGIRFLDIRVRYLGGKLKVYHGFVYQRAHLDKVLEDVARFLRRHPTEVVLMRLRLERSRVAIGTSDMVMKKYFSQYDDVLWRRLNVRNPTLGQVRGKMIILQDFPGYDPLGWPYDSLDIAEDWRVPTLGHVDQKWQGVLEHLEAAESGTEDTIFLTYASGASFHVKPKDLARQINVKLHDFMLEKITGWNRPCFGIIAMDFPSAALIQIIIDFNKEYDNTAVAIDPIPGSS